jgi:hypothetical protein
MTVSVMNLSYDGVYRLQIVDRFQIPSSGHEVGLIRPAILGFLKIKVSKIYFFMVYMNHIIYILNIAWYNRNMFAALSRQ